jgi:quercetin 2,3-dioxygenase
LGSRTRFGISSPKPLYDWRDIQVPTLRVINEDRVAPGEGFGTHGHTDMEIISYVLGGQLAHRDSMGTGSVIVPGDVQRMSAGTGVRHSEMNASTKDSVHFLQIWIQPAALGIPPSYEQKHFPPAEMRGKLRLIVASDGSEGAVTLHQDVRLYAGLFDAAEEATLSLAESRRGYVHVAYGTITVNETRLEAGDALKITGAQTLRFHSGVNAELLVFDLPL